MGLGPLKGAEAFLCSDYGGSFLDDHILRFFKNSDLINSFFLFYLLFVMLLHETGPRPIISKHITILRCAFSECLRTPLVLVVERSAKTKEPSGSEVFFCCLLPMSIRCSVPTFFASPSLSPLFNLIKCRNVNGFEGLALKCLINLLLSKGIPMPELLPIQDPQFQSDTLMVSKHAFSKATMACAGTLYRFSGGFFGFKHRHSIWNFVPKCH